MSIVTQLIEQKHPIKFTEPPAGACPVQAQGTYEDIPFYFRYRFGSAQLYIGCRPVQADIPSEKRRYAEIAYGDGLDGWLDDESLVEVFDELIKNLHPYEEGETRVERIAEELRSLGHGAK